ncbi:unnamed protein product [Amoebophrya sp. A120]|nr:unnamed protein product [Amoebophrya sp. A120]|eukprot:GSA120T00000698001.1
MRICFGILPHMTLLRYHIFAQAGVIGVLALPHLNRATVEGKIGALSALGDAVLGVPESGPLLAYCGFTCMLMSFYGGQFSVLPSYVADLFSEKHAGAIHGRILTAWSAASVLGPQGLAWFREQSYRRACADLAKMIPGEEFESRFGVAVTELDTLVSAKTVTIQRLLELCPAGTLDPSLTLYNDSFIAIAGALAGAGFFNGMIRQVDPQHFVPGTAPVVAGKAGTTSGERAASAVSTASTPPAQQGSTKSGTRPGGGISV